MNRKRFLYTSTLAGIGLQFPFQAFFNKPIEFQNISMEQVLGLDTSHLEPSPILLEKETYKFFSKMQSAALKDDIHLQIVSGYRSFSQQKQIWEKKYNQLLKTHSSSEAISEIITYSSIPGTSRHHWGTDIDIIDQSVQLPKGDILLEKHYHGTGVFSNLKLWMERYGSDFGFVLVYTDDTTRTGFLYEPWHYSFSLTSKDFLSLQMKESFQKSWEKLSFDGKSKMTPEFIASYFKNYALGINTLLMPS
jgi:LAS superfamily LD-carboxypeptidase LdcB